MAEYYIFFPFFFYLYFSFELFLFSDRLALDRAQNDTVKTTTYADLVKFKRCETLQSESAITNGNGK